MNYSLMYTWKHQNYQLNVYLKDRFKSINSAFNFACNIKELEYKLENQIADDPRKVFWTGSLPTQKDLSKSFPRLILKLKDDMEYELPNKSNRFTLFKGSKYSEEDGVFNQVEKADITLVDFFKSLKQDVVFKPMIFNVFDDAGNVVLLAGSQALVMRSKGVRDEQIVELLSKLYP